MFRVSLLLALNYHPLLQLHTYDDDFMRGSVIILVDHDEFDKRAGNSGIVDVGICSRNRRMLGSTLFRYTGCQRGPGLSDRLRFVEGQ